MSTHNTTTDESSAASGMDGPLPAKAFGVRLVHTSPVSAKEERVLKQTMQRAERKFHLGYVTNAQQTLTAGLTSRLIQLSFRPDWFPPAVAPSECRLTADLIHRSLAQNELIFSSESLSLLTLDHIYTFKAALASYALTHSSCVLEDAVDELRRLVLAQGGRKLRKSVLLSSFTWLGPVSDAALSDVIRMYRRAYGGVSGESGVENDVEAKTSSNNRRNSVQLSSWPLPEQPVFMIGPESDKPLPALPDEAWQSSSETTSESGESSGWESEDLPSVRHRRTSSNASKRFAVIGLDFDFGIDFEIEDYYRLSSARDLLTEREEAEAAAWAAAGASGEATDRADGILVTGLVEGKAEAMRPVRPREPSPGSSGVEGMQSLPLFLEESEHGRATPKVAEKPRLQLQTCPAAPHIGISKPVPLRLPMLKLQTTFSTKPIIAQTIPVIPLNRRLTLSGGETTLNLVGMTPVESRMPFAANNHTNKPYEDEEDGELTAKPISALPGRQHRWTQRWNSLVSIEGRLATPPLDQHSIREGPTTPNGYGDISPITRGEWGFLFQGETWQNGRTVTVETC